MTTNVATGLHDALDGLPQIVVPDSNNLLNAAFIGDSTSYRALTALKEMGFVVVAAEQIIEECRNVLLHRCRHMRLDPRPICRQFDGYLHDERLLLTATVFRSDISNVPKHDRHVAAAALASGAWILTHDLELTVSASTLGIEARQPWDVIVEHSCKKNGGYRIDDLIRGTCPGRSSGFMFCRLAPGEWAGQREIGQFTACEVDRVGRLFFETGDSTWRFCLANGTEVVVPASVARNEDWVVCGSYRLGANAKKHVGQIRLYVAGPDGLSKIGHQVSLRQLGSDPPTTMCVAHDQNNDRHWWGTIKAAVFGRQYVAPHGWSKLIKLPNSAPDPYEIDMLDQAISIVSHKKSRTSGALRRFELPLTDVLMWQ